MKYISVCLILFLLSTLHLFAQHETDERVLGYKHFLKFNQNNAELTIESPNFFKSDVWHANGEAITHYANSICDTLGHLLFYYDGINVYGKDKAKLINGNVHAKNFGTYYYYSSLIVPIEESNRRYYYLFETIPYEENWNTTQNPCGVGLPCPEFLELCKLQYHIIDMGVDGMHGEIISKNNFVIDSVSSSLSGVKHQNNIDTWVTVMKFKSNEVYNFKVNSCEIGKPVISIIPDFEYEIKPINYCYLFRFAFGFQIVYSTKGDYVTFNGYKLSDPLPTGNDLRYAYLYYSKFNNATGAIDIGSLKTTGPSSIYQNTYTVGPALFSHDSEKIYYFSQRNDSYITELDISTNTSIIVSNYGGSFQASPLDYGKNNDFVLCKIIPSYVPNFPYTPPFYYNDYSYFTYSQYLYLLGNIGNGIVVNTVDYKSNEYRSPIFDPICRNNYIYNFYHPDYKKPNAFPVAQAVTNKIASPSCFTSPVILKGHTTTPVDSLFWIVKKSTNNTWQRYNDDTIQLALNTGKYTASLVSYKYCLADTNTQQFVLEDYPVVHLVDDTLYTCESKSLDLPINTIYKYNWYNQYGNPTSNTVYQTGQYDMVVKNSCGKAKDSIYLQNSTVQVMNLVTPNNDAKNDCLFTVSNNPNEHIQLSIYNSWGSRVFYDASYSNNWCPQNDIADGVYYYEAVYNNACTSKGWVQVLH